jgi:hypothetical protein
VYERRLLADYQDAATRVELPFDKKICSCSNGGYRAVAKPDFYDPLVRPRRACLPKAVSAEG